PPVVTEPVVGSDVAHPPLDGGDEVVVGGDGALEVQLPLLDADRTEGVPAALSDCLDPVVVDPPSRLQRGPRLEVALQLVREALPEMVPDEPHQRGAE